MNFIKATIDRLEECFAVLRTEDAQEILWPLKNLPEGIKEGTAVRLVLSTNENDEEERKKLAKSLLNEILQNSSDGEER
jgi:predicted DNA-binding antitoxin AbrB/MazE fold protein